MASSPFLPLPDGLSIEHVTREPDRLVVEVCSTLFSVPCPSCQTMAERLHSRYQRTVADMSCGGQHVVLHLTVRRMLCPNPDCPYTVFAERFPGLVRVYARMTDRLIAALQQMGLATTGESGSRLAQTLAMPISPDTLLRRILDLPVPDVGFVPIVGVDDWAWRKGQRYGSIVVDLVQHRVVALLEERSSTSVSAWLATHPEVTIVCRDRGSAYIEGATQGAPQAMQVADRWHLLHTLRETAEQVLERHRAALHTIVAASASPTNQDVIPPVARDERLRLERRAKRYATFERVLVLDRLGWHYPQIAQDVGVSVRTISRYLTSQQFPERFRRTRRSQLVPFMPYLRQRWEEGCHNASQLWRELQGQGFPGSQSLVASYLTCLRHPDRWHRPEMETVVRRSSIPRRAVWLFVRDPEALSPQEHQDLEQFQSNAPELFEVYALAQSFRQLIVQQHEEALNDWMHQALASTLSEFRRLAEGFRRDLVAIRAALQVPWSSGQVEGQVNRLKALKRQMYGRAKFPLLLRRVLFAA